MMNNFKLPKEFRNAFKQKSKSRLAVKKEPLPFDVKQQIQTKARPTFDAFVKEENIKMESNYKPISSMGWCTTVNFEPEPKHEICISKTEEYKPEPACDSFCSKSTLKLLPKKKRTRQKTRPQIVIAINVHRNLCWRDPDSLTRRQLDSLNWAESVIVSNALRRIAPESAPTEILDVEDDVQVIDEIIELIPDTLQLAVVDSANPGGRYSLENARLIETTLSKAVISYILENPRAKQPVFGKSVYFDGVLVLDCKDETTYNFAKLILNYTKLWENSRLKLIEPEKTPFKSIGSLNIPDIGIDKNMVIDILKAQNPTIDMHNWKILGETKYKNGYKHYSIMMSNPPVYFQRHKQLRLHFGGSEIQLKLFGCQWLWNCKV